MARLMSSCDGIFATRLESEHDGDKRVYVDRADPVVHVSAVVLAMLSSPADERVLTEVIPGPVPGDYTGAVLKIYADDRTVIYRVTGPCEHGCWRMQFPD